jgi:uncharacterized protein (TIGR00730 family)
MRAMRSICVFCGSSPGNHPGYLQVAAATGELLAQRNLKVIYGGGRVGLMGALADAALRAGGQVVGVIPQLLIDEEVGHTGLSELLVVNTMAERKLMMGNLADGFITLPGGIGTMDELFEAWTWTQLGLQDKPSGLLNHRGYYDPLIEFVDRAVEHGFLTERSRATLFVDTDMTRLLTRMQGL